MVSDEDVKSGDLSCTAQLVHTLGTRGVRLFHRLRKNLSHHIAPYLNGVDGGKIANNAPISRFTPRLIFQRI